MAKLRIPCTVCGGDGISWRSGILGTQCGSCSGTGWMEGPDLPALDTAIETLADILDKCNDIIAEQAAQRTDLTAALTQIWNKVKDL